MHFVNEPWLVTAVLLLIVVPLTWKLGNWKGKTDADVGALKENVDRLILRMDNFIATFSGRAKGGVAGSQSPVRLNAYGKKLAKKIDAAEIVDAFAARADAETKGMNAYQIQERCVTFSLRVVLEELKHHDKPRFDRVAEVAFNEWIMIEKIAYVIALLLCDRILQMRGMARANANAEAIPIGENFVTNLHKYAVNKKEPFRQPHTVHRLTRPNCGQVTSSENRIDLGECNDWNHATRKAGAKLREEGSAITSARPCPNCERAMRVDKTN